MKLERLRIRNFRCFRDEASIDFDGITALVGKNDVGKSTVMEALDIFLNDGTPDKDDASKNGDGKDLTIICEFTEIPHELIIDDTNPTNLKREFLLNENERLEIHKKYSGHTANPKCISIMAYAVHPTAEGVGDLLQLKNADLKKRAKELNVNLSGTDKKVNADIREQIRNSIADLKLAPIMIPLNDDNAKSVWTGLKKYIPAFALFKSDRESTDQDPEAQDPLKAAIKQAIKEKESELNLITAYVETEVKKIATATLDKLKEMDPSLAQELTPQFSKPKWEAIFKASITGDENIPINKRGSGVKRLILLNFFRAKAEQLAKDSGSQVIYGIEEPETSQHPNNQRMLLRAFVELSSEAQVILSTHTPMLARSIPDKNLRYIRVREDKCREILYGGSETNKIFAKSLGVLPDNNVKLFIGVEGKHDIAFIQGMAKVLLNEGIDILDLEKMELDGELIFFPLGGSTLALWTSRLANLGRPEFHLYDRDVSPPSPSKYQLQIDAINMRDKCIARHTEKREIENYIHIEAINRAYSDFSIDLGLINNYADFDDIPLEVAKLVHGKSGSPKRWEQLDDQDKKEKESKAKRILNSYAVKYMSKHLLDNIDPNGDFLSWIEDMKKLTITESAAALANAGAPDGSTNAARL